jgi:hypothetical protein
MGEAERGLPYDVESFIVSNPPDPPQRAFIEVKCTAHRIEDDPIIYISQRETQAMTAIANDDSRLLYLVFDVQSSPENWVLVRTRVQDIQRLRPSQYTFRPLSDGRQTPSVLPPGCSGCQLTITTGPDFESDEDPVE